jgi:hypothetical protein
LAIFSGIEPFDGWKLFKGLRGLRLFLRHRRMLLSYGLE